MKTNLLIWIPKLFFAVWIPCALMLPVLLLAQAAGEPLPPLPDTTGEMWKFAIMGLTPLIVTGIKIILPKLPKLLLPVSTPFIGIVLGLALKYLGLANLGWVDMGQAGVVAVFIYETWSQGVKAMSTPTQ